MSLAPGDQFGRYEIVGLLGHGGMGEVYRARDPQLGRQIAIKVLASHEGALSEGERRRFENEARTVSGLNHPSIVTIYELGTKPEPYIAMELVEGMSLREALAAGAIPPRSAVDFAAQVADGLARAHEAGVIHRDLKPENIMITPDSHAKILDFGLAKLRPLELSANSESPTIANGLTHPGAILGTVGYMAPEQARGEEADASTDQFAFGSILYEMVTGVRAYSRGSAIETLASVLNEEPESISELQPRTPAPLRWVIERCLQKSRRDRYSSTRDLARELQTLKEHFGELSRSTTTSSAIRIQPRKKFRLGKVAPWAVGAAILALAILGGIVAGSRLYGNHGLSFQFTQLTFRAGSVGAAKFAPDGNQIAYGEESPQTVASGIYLTRTDSAGSEHLLQPGRALPMAFDAAGAELLVISQIWRGGFLPTGTMGWTPILGGQIRPLLSNIAWADWAPRNHFFVVVVDQKADRTLEVVDQNGKPVRILDRTPGAFSNVRISPDEKSVAYIAHPSMVSEEGSIRLASVLDGTIKNLTPNFATCLGLDWEPKSGEIWFTTAQHSSLAALFAVNRNGQLRQIYSAPDWLYLFDISPDGSSILIGTIAGTTALMVQKEGKDATDLSWSATTAVSDISRDGKTILFSAAQTLSNPDFSIWMRNIDGEMPIRLDAGSDGRFSPDGREVVALTAGEYGSGQIIIVPTAAGSLQQITKANGEFDKPVFSADGSYLLAAYRPAHKGVAIWKLSLSGQLLKQLTPDGCDDPVVSPDGKFIAGGCSDFANVTTFPVSGGTGTLIWKAPTGEFVNPLRWSADGKSIFALLARSSEIVSVPVKPGGSPALVRRLLPNGATDTDHVFDAAISADGSIAAWSVSQTRIKLDVGKIMPDDRSMKF